MLIGMDLSAALSSKGKVMKGLARAAITFATIVTAPGSYAEVSRFDWKSNVFDDSLQNVLAQVGDEHLNHNVQYLDMAGGCINTLCDEGSYKAQAIYMTATSSIPLIPPARKKNSVGTGVASWQRW
jgi:phosphoserine aminotransferase